MVRMAVLFPLLGIVLGNGIGFSVEASDVAGLLEIRKFGLTGVLIPETTKLRQRYLDAVSAAKSMPCDEVSMPQMEDCAACVEEKCTDRAKHICSTNRFFQAQRVIQYFISGQLRNLISPGTLDLSADEALSEYADFIVEYQAVRPRPRRLLPEMCNSRSIYLTSSPTTPSVTPYLSPKPITLSPEPLQPIGKRYSDVAPPFCPELRQNYTACAFFLPECPCAPLCVNYLRALEARRRFLHAVPGFLKGYSVEMFKLDLTTFNKDLGGFTLAEVRVVLDGETYEFSAEHPSLPYTPETTGQLIAEQALKEYYRKYPSRQTPLSAIVK